MSSTTPNASSAHACIEIKDVLGHQETALYLLCRNSIPTKFAHNIKKIRLQNSPYFCVFKYAPAVKQKVWNEAENREQDWGEMLKIRTVCFAYAILILFELPASASHGQFPLAKFRCKLSPSCQVMFSTSHSRYSVS